MKIKKIHLTNFRKFKNSEFKFSKNNNLILGDNATGKTTIIEAIYYCCFFSSFRAKTSEELILFNQEIASVNLYFEDEENKINTIKVNFYKKEKRFFYNDIRVKKLSVFFKKLNIILIAPSSIDLIDSNPTVRRKYLDQSISKIDTEYLNTLIEYKKILKNKNKYLKSIRSKEQLDEIYYKVVTEKLLHLNEKIIEKRNTFLNYLEIEMSSILYEISSKKEKIEINYLEKTCDNVLEQEIRFQRTMTGIHLDDYQICLNKLEAKQYGSQGQKRLISIAYFFGQNKIIYKKTKIKPVIIFDDVQLELDQNRQAKLIKYFDGNNQLIYVTTNIEKIKNLNNSSTNIIKITNNKN